VIRRLASSFALDNRVFFRSNYYFVQLGIAAIYLVLILVVVPDDASTKPTLYLADRTTSSELAARFDGDARPEITTIGEVSFVDDEREVRASVRGNEGSLGAVVTDAGPEQFFFQGQESARARKLMVADISHALDAIVGGDAATAEAIPTRLLGKAQDPITFNKALVPMLLFLDAGMIGMIFIAAAMFKEREDGVLRALMVSPAAVWEYLTSKAAALAVLALVFGAAFVPIAVGSRPDYLPLAGILALGSISTTVIGAAVAVRFTTFQQFFFPSIVLINVLGLIPAVSYLVPSFNASWMQWLPTYHFMYAVRETVYPSGNGDVIWQAFVVMTIVTAVFMALCLTSFKSQLVRR
jgi:ABC-type multidrug transport system permease subunit